MKKFKVKELRFSNLLVEDINVPKILLFELRIFLDLKRLYLKKLLRKLAKNMEKMLNTLFLKI